MKEKYLVEINKYETHAEKARVFYEMVYEELGLKLPPIINKERGYLFKDGSTGYYSGKLLYSNFSSEELK